MDFSCVFSALALPIKEDGSMTVSSEHSRRKYNLLRQASHHMFEALTETLGARTFFVAEYEDGSNLTVSSWNRDETTVQEGGVQPFHLAYCKLVCDGTAAVIIDDTSDHPPTKGMDVTKQIGACSFIAVPIATPGGTLFGIICAMDRTRRFTRADVSVLDQLARTVACFVELEDMIVHDDLTGLYNRGYVETFFQEPSERYPLAVAFMDLNDFKLINDTYGHDFGDAVLQHVGSTLRRLSADERFIPCRYAGDEFLVIFPAYRHKEEVVLLLEYILAEMAKPVYIAGRPFSVTASMGACFDADSLNAYVARADWAMYRVKNDTKHGISIYDRDNEDWVPKSG